MTTNHPSVDPFFVNRKQNYRLFNRKATQFQSEFLGEGEALAEPKTAAISDWRLVTG